jgi:outer membrane protein assembly factor BamB
MLGIGTFMRKRLMVLSIVVSNRFRFLSSKRKLSLILLGILFVGLVITGFGPATLESNGYRPATWSSYRHDAENTGFSGGLAPNTNQTAWTVGGASGTITAGMCPVVAEGKIFVCDDQTGNLTAFNETTGKQLWKYQGSSLISSSPAVAYGKVFSGSEGANNVKVFDENNGTLLSSYTIGGGGAANSAQVADGRVFFNAQANQTLYCMNATIGQTLWTYPTGCNKAYPAVVDGRVFVAHYSSTSKVMGLHCLNESNGSFIWKFENASSKSMGRLTPIVSNGEVYFFNNATTSALYCLDEFTGVKIWKYQYSGFYSRAPPALAYNTVYLSSADGYVYAINAQTGTLSWRHYTGAASYQDSGPSTPSVADGKVFVSTSANVTSLNATNGNLLWTYKVSSPNPPVAADGYVVFSTPNALYVLGSYARHDVAVKSAVSFKNVVGQGYSSQINVIVENEGNYTETFNVTAYANTTMIGTQIVQDLPNGMSKLCNFAWNTSDYAKGNYTISAYAWPVLGETNTANNVFVYGTVQVAKRGDVNADGSVDVLDLIVVAKALGTYPGDPKYNPNADINSDVEIDVLDLILVAKYLGT